jgi:hypothetical protein
MYVGAVVFEVVAYIVVVVVAGSSRCSGNSSGSSEVAHWCVCVCVGILLTRFPKGCLEHSRHG